MSFVDSSQELWKEVQSIVEDEGLRLYDIERAGASSLRVVVSTPPSVAEESARGQGGVTTDDCARVCRRLMTFFTVEGPRLSVATEPQIEVSSPGVNRDLRLPEHFESAVGERIKVTWQPVQDGLRNSQTAVGILQVFDNGCLSLVEEKSGEKKDVLLNEVRKARVDFPF